MEESRAQNADPSRVQESDNREFAGQFHSGWPLDYGRNSHFEQLLRGLRHERQLVASNPQISACFRWE